MVKGKIQVLHDLACSNEKLTLHSVSADDILLLVVIVSIHQLPVWEFSLPLPCLSEPW